jgi:CelD/BcsL family acetyltransferase involved in cellulose biosynthesis
MLIIEEITETNALERMTGVWNKILLESDADTIFLTWEWVFNWWQVYRKGKKLLVLVLKDQNKDIVSIAPLYLQRKRVLEGFWINEVRFIGSGEDVSPDYLDFIIKRGREDEAIAAIIKYFHAWRGWDAINLTDIVSTSHTIKVLPLIGGNDGFRVENRGCSICPYISLPSSWEEYLSGLSQNMRYNIKRRMKNLDKTFRTRYFFWEDIEGLQRAMEKLASLHRNRWKGRSWHYAFSTSEFNSFQQIVAKEFAHRGWLQLSCLELDGEIIGMFYDFKYGNKFYYFQGGFEPSLKSYSVGLVLRAFVIQKAIEMGIGEIDLLKGPYDHKYRWTSLDRHTCNLTIGKDSFASKLFFFDTFRKPQIKSTLKKFLPESLLKMIKRATDVGAITHR